jgi:hypothetical protein
MTEVRVQSRYMLRFIVHLRFRAMFLYRSGSFICARRQETSRF